MHSLAHDGKTSVEYMVRSDDMAGQLLAGEVEHLPFLETIHVTLFL